MKIVSTNPGRHYEVIGEAEAASEADIAKAVENARKAQPLWAELSLKERCDKIRSFLKVCEGRVDDIAKIMSKEMGKPIGASREQVESTFGEFEDYMKQAEQALAPSVVFENDTEKHIQTLEPRGVIAAIAPWNFPFNNISFQVGQALIAGNTVVYKPSEETVLFTQLIAQLVAESELPAGVFTPIIGDGRVGEVLVRQNVDMILFTGSTRTGQRITEIAAERSIPVLTEMGGSAPGIVFDDAEVPKIINTFASMRFDNTGQYCDGLKRAIVHVSKYDEFLKGLKEYAANTKIGDQLDEETKIGPLVAKRQLDVLEAQVADAVEKGAEVFIGGKQPEGLEGAYYEVTVLIKISPDMRVWKEEVFGPVLPVVTFETEEEAIKLANDTEYGLGAFVFTEDIERYRRVAKQIKAGNIAHNTAWYFSPSTPFGGYKKSGNGRSQGLPGFHEVTQIKVIAEEK
ncbi:MAG TPA: aldehyde dehydrogenase family protein [Candidatus Saccharimonadales bacterium]|nr:aldehyde dehydrogenase family protein [Candidatus Saccharimonadales bacterium]